MSLTVPSLDGRPPRFLQPAQDKSPAAESITGSAPDQSFWSTPSSGSSEGAKLEKCYLCANSYKNSQSLRRHLREKHGGQDGIVEAAKYQCLECEKVFLRPDGLKNHCVKVHAGHSDGMNTAGTVQDVETIIQTSLAANGEQDLNVSSGVGSEDHLPELALQVQSHSNEQDNAWLSPFETDPDARLSDLGSTTVSADRHTHLQRADIIIDNIATMSGLWECRSPLDTRPATNDTEQNAMDTLPTVDEPITIDEPTTIDEPRTTNDLLTIDEFGETADVKFENETTYSVCRDHRDHPDRCCIHVRWDSGEEDHLTVGFRVWKWTTYCQRHGKDPKTYCRPYNTRIPLPFQDLPESQDLEALIRRKERMRRFDRFMNVFREAHLRFQKENAEPPDWKLHLMDEDVLKTLQQHKSDPRRAFKDGLRAMRRLLAGVLPSELNAAMGIAEIASAMGHMLGEEKPLSAAQDDLLSDLPRLKVALTPADRIAYDFYTRLLWGDRPVKNVEWKDVLDAENLQYLQDLLSKLLLDSGFELADDCSSGCEDCAQARLSTPPYDSSSQPQREPKSPSAGTVPVALYPEASQRTAGSSGLHSQEIEPGLTLELSFVVVASGAIFGFVLTFVLLFFNAVNVSDVRECFGSNREATWDMLKSDYLAALLKDVTVSALPSVSQMIHVLLASETMGGIALIERELMHLASWDAPSHTYGDYFTSCLQDAMKLCGEQGRRWLRNSSLIINCRLLEVLLGSQRKPLTDFHGWFV